MAPRLIPAAEQPKLATRRRKKYRSMKEIMKVAKRVVLTENDGDEECHSRADFYSRAACEKCGSGDRADELLLCDKCDRGYHIFCVRPIVARVPIGPWFCSACSGDHNRPLKNVKKRRRRGRPLVVHKKRRRFLPYIPSEDRARRQAQMSSLAIALTAQSMEFSNELTYMPGMAPRSANLSAFENGRMQVLSKEDAETLEYCSAMYRRGEHPPLMVTFDSCEGYTVEADGPIKDMTLLAEFAGDVDYIKNREEDDCDSLMTLLLASDPTKSLLICPDKRGNIARFFSGINNHTPEGRKKQNVKCVRYSVNGECRVLLVATRDISRGERLYYDYNGHEHEYPTYHFV